MLWARVFLQEQCGIFIVNQLGKHGFFVSFLLPSIYERRKRFSDQMNRNRIDPILSRHGWTCSTTENLNAITLL